MTILNKDSQLTESTKSKIVVQILAIVGFITLIGAGIMFAVYSARFTPSIIGTFESGTAYIHGTFFKNTKQTNLTIVPQQTKLPFKKKSDNNIKNYSTTKNTRNLSVKKSTKNVQWHAGKETGSKLYPLGTHTITAPKYYGLPDLVTTIMSVGYLNGTSTSSFIKTLVIPAHMQVAVKFRVVNQGTNITGPWNLEIHIPTELNFIYSPKTIKSLLPGQPEDFIVHFTNAIAGANKKITIIADPKNLIKELKENNNSSSVSVTILGN